MSTPINELQRRQLIREIKESKAEVEQSAISSTALRTGLIPIMIIGLRLPPIIDVVFPVAEPVGKERNRWIKIKNKANFHGPVRAQDLILKRIME